MIRHRIYVDGKPAAAVSARDRGLQFGDGLFETMAVIDGHVRFLSLHLQRLANGCQSLGIVAPDAPALKVELTALAQQLQTGVIKLIVTRGSGARGYVAPYPQLPRRIVYCNDWPVLPAAIKLRVCQTRLASGGSLAGIKHLNRLEQVMARNEWRANDTADDGLMLDSEDYVIETTNANLFVVKDGKMMTPSVSRSGVAGVMRSVVMQLPSAVRAACHEIDLRLHTVIGADEVFVTNALAGITPVTAVGDQPLSTGTLTRALQSELRDVMAEDASR